MKRRSLVFLLFAFVGNLVAQGRTGGDLRVEVLRTWADDNVKWIICPAEKEVFDRLTSDTDRKAFIDAFWYRRDPNPLTPVNEAKQEHYKRLDFADGHFRENELRGSLTERGRVWIVHGPPQRRDVHPHRANHSFPEEIWHYEQIPEVGVDLDFRFVDGDNSGKYRLELRPEDRERMLALWQCEKTMVYRLP